MACNITIDYSSVPGSRTLPFEFSLDLTESILEPAPGRRQKFCYHIRAMGAEEFDHVNLTYFMIGLCEGIDEAQLGEITVVRDGVREQATLGENVLLLHAEAPDPNTGCSGLKFMFPLDKISGEMDVSFELTRAYRIGPQPVCVYGSGVVRNVLSLCGPVCRLDEKCTRTVHQNTRVSVPIGLTPYVRVGEATAQCFGAPEITPSPDGNPRENAFVISQKMCVSVPITFIADAHAGDVEIECLGAPPCGCKEETQDS